MTEKGLAFWASAEVERSAFQNLDAIRRLVEPWLNEAFATSALAQVDGAIWYIPIVMPPASEARYPARSRFQKSKRVYSCCPQLDYAVFVSQDRDAHLKCYLDGLQECAPYLMRLGATIEQTDVFLRLLERAFEELRKRH